MRRGVTLLTVESGMFAFKCVPGQTVVELFFGGFPTNKIEVLAVVLEVATHAILAGGILHLHAKVVAMLGSEGFGNLFVTIEAFESGSAGAKDVAGIALGSAGQGRVGFRKWARRDLGGRRGSEGQKQGNDHKQISEWSNSTALSCS